MEEIWKDVVGYEGLYEVSSFGKVRTHTDKTTYTKRHGVRRWKQRILKQKSSKDGNNRVSLWLNGVERTWLVHRVVALAFIPLVEGKEIVNHKDGDKKNNCVENLEWCTYTENSNHAFDFGLMPSAVRITLVNSTTGERHDFRSMTKAGEFLGRSHGAISALLKNGEREVDGFIVERRS